MRTTLLSTVALLATVGLAAAQGGPGAAGQRSSPNAGAEHGTSQGAQQEHGKERGSPAQQSQTQKGREPGQTTGQSPRQQGQAGEREQRQQGQQSQHEPGRQGAQPQQRGQRDQTTGQNPREQSQPSQRQQGQQSQPGQREPGRQGAQQQRGQRDQNQTTGQNPREQSQPAQRQPGQQAPSQNQAGQAQQERGTVSLTTEQRTRIRSTVLARSDVPRADHVTFAIRVGTAIPESMHVVVVPEPLIEIHPEWRGHYYFVSGEDVVIVDSGHRIVAVVPVGTGSSTQLENRGGERGSAMQGQLSSEEIRQVQIALKQKGFAVEIDGVMGPRTREALMSFQRREGLQVTGQIDQRTSGSLGISGQSGSTTGQGNPPSGQGQNQQAPSAGQQNGQPPQSGQDHSTTGQSPPRSNQQAPSAGQQNGHQPSGNQPPLNNPSNSNGMGGNQGQRMQQNAPAR